MPSAELLYLIGGLQIFKTEKDIRENNCQRRKFTINQRATFEQLHYFGSHKIMQMFRYKRHYVVAAFSASLISLVRVERVFKHITTRNYLNMMKYVEGKSRRKR